MKMGADRNPKFVSLMELLGVSRPMTVGVLELLWHATAEFAPQGDIGRFDNRGIAKLIGWKGKPERLVAALVEAHWLDPDPTHRLLVHDWSDHAPEYVKKRLARADIPLFDPAADNGRQDPPSCLPTMPYHNHALPSPTQPNQERENSGLSPAHQRILSLSFPHGATQKQRQATLQAVTQAERNGVPLPFLESAIISPKAEGTPWQRIDGAIAKAKHIANSVTDTTGKKRFVDLQHLVDYAKTEGLENLPSTVSGWGMRLILKHCGVEVTEPPAGESPRPG